MDKIKERENALDFIVNSPEIALKMMERMEKDAEFTRKLKKALNETRKELRQTKKDLIQARHSAENLHRLAIEDGNAPAPLPWEE